MVIVKSEKQLKNALENDEKTITIQGDLADEVNKLIFVKKASRASFLVSPLLAPLGAAIGGKKGLEYKKLIQYEVSSYEQHEELVIVKRKVNPALM